MPGFTGLNKYLNGSYQMLGHLYSDWCDLLTVFADHLLDDVGKIVILCLAHNVKEGLHHGPDVGGDVIFG